MPSPATVVTEPVAASTRPKRWRSLVISFAIVGSAALLVVLVALTPKPEQAPTPVVVPPVNVTVETVRAVPELPDTFELTAVVEPNRVVKVAAEVAGRIERYGTRPRDRAWHGQTLAAGSELDEGQPVQAGDPLLHLNRDLIAARFDRAKAQFDFDERELRRLQDLLARDATSQKEVDDARTKLAISKAALDEAERELERTDIAAPLTGVVNRLTMEVGEYASPGDMVAEIVECDPVKVAVDVPERDIGYLQCGDPVLVLPRRDAPALTGEITYIGVLAHDGTRTTRVEITLPNADGALRSGQIVRARLTRRMLRDVIMIPLASVIPLEHGREVYVVENERARRRPVELGFIRGQRVHVLSGLQTGETLIVTGQRLLADQQSVRVVDSVTETQPAGGRTAQAVEQP